MAHTEHKAGPHAEQHHHEGHHIIPKKTLLTIFGALVFLTILTAITAEYVDIGVLNVPLALAIAGTKAALVVMFFMALKYDNSVNVLVFIVGTIFVVIFLTFTLFDTAFRGDVGNVDALTIEERTEADSLRRLQEPDPEALNRGPILGGDITAPESVREEAAEAMDEANTDERGLVNSEADAVEPENDEVEQRP